MSIEKDVEKLYRGDAEKQRKNQKKKKKKNFITLLLIVVFIIAVILLMNYLGLGFGGGKGEGGESSADSQTSSSAEDKETTTTTTTEAVPKEYIGIKVSGSTYIYQGSEVTVENIAETVRLMTDNVVVVITDDNATQNAMDALTAAFEADHREYLIETPAAESDASSESAEPDAGTVTTLVP